MNGTLFASVFLITFLAELPDKSTLTAVFLTSRYPARGVFIGAAGALIIQSLIAVALGTLVLRFVSPHAMRVVSGLIFLGAGLFIGWKKDEDEGDFKDAGEGTRGNFGQAVTTAFGLVFAAELGDITQLSTATLAAKYQAPGTIFAAAALAECSVCALGILLGSSLKKLLPQKLFQKLSAAVFAAVGIFLLTRG